MQGINWLLHVHVYCAHHIDPYKWYMSCADLIEQFEYSRGSGTSSPLEISNLLNSHNKFTLPPQKKQSYPSNPPPSLKIVLGPRMIVYVTL